MLRPTCSNVFQLFRSLGHILSRETEHLKITYFVKKGFQEEYKGKSLQIVESNVENDYIDYLQKSCWKEKQQSKYAFKSWRLLIKEILN